MSVMGEHVCGMEGTGMYKSQLCKYNASTHMSVEFSRNAFAKGLLQIFSCVTCEVIDDWRWFTVSLTGQPVAL